MRIYITFGCDHTHKVGDKVFNKDCVASIECDTYEEGREKAVILFGKKWCMAHDKVDARMMSYYKDGIVSVDDSQETPEEFLARGGKITELEYTAKPSSKAKKIFSEELKCKSDMISAGK